MNKDSKNQLRFPMFGIDWPQVLMNKDNNKITELRTIFQRESYLLLF